MDVVATPSCLYCGAATSDYLDHLLDLHKFSLAMAREVIGAGSDKDSQESIITNATSKSKDDSVLTVGGVPIRLPAVNAGGGSIPKILFTNRSPRSCRGCLSSSDIRAQ